MMRLLPLLAVLVQAPSIAAEPGYAELVRRSADEMISHGTDRWGREHSPKFDSRWLRSIWKGVCLYSPNACDTWRLGRTGRSRWPWSTSIQLMPFASLKRMAIPARPTCGTSCASRISTSSRFRPGLWAKGLPTTHPGRIPEQSANATELLLLAWSIKDGPRGRTYLDVAKARAREAVDLFPEFISSYLGGDDLMLRLWRPSQVTGSDSEH